MAQPFVRVEASNYTSVPKVNAQSGVALARALIVALPKDSPPSTRHAARQMRAVAITLQRSVAASHAAEPSGEKRTSRAIDNEADALHSTVTRRLEDHELLAAHEPAKAQQAATLKKALYPKGDALWRGDMMTQWQATEDWFIALAVDGREAALRSLVGGGFVDAIRAVHAEYGEAIGTTKPRAPTPPKVDLAAPLAALAQSMQDLALQLVALANDGSASDALRSAARDALRPIDDHREGNARRTAARAPDDAPEPTPDEKPLPEV